MTRPLSRTPTPGLLVTPETAAAAGALVMLGEPGLGKTTVLEQLTEGLPEYRDAAPGQPARLWLDAARLSDTTTFRHLLGRHLHSLPAGQPTPQVRSGGRREREEEPVPRHDVTLTVVLDQIDESPMLRLLAVELAEALAGRDTAGLRILVACRAADYPSGLTEVLTDATGGCRMVDLAPFTRTDAVRLATSVGVDGEALAAKAVASGAGALASVPLTLEILVRIFRTGGWASNAKDLFDQGVRLLADEHDNERRPAAAMVASARQRLAVGQRIAAHLVLSGRRTIWRGPELGAGPLDVPAGRLDGGSEETDNGSFEVTSAIVQATLGTALFTGRGEHRLAFRHASVAAYLAACYLQRHQLPQAQLASLFLVAAGDDVTSIPALLGETAAWLMVLAPANSEWLARADPESIAAHSAIVDASAMRALIVESLLARAAEVELAEPSWQRSRWELAHPGLADQLAAVLRAASATESADWTARARVRLAVRLAQQAEVGELADPLLRLAEDDQWDVSMRQSAARAAFFADPTVASPRLRALLGRLDDATGAAQLDPRHELRGTLLALLWPRHLPLADMLPLLRSRQPRSPRDASAARLGVYDRFLRIMPVGVSESELPELLTWAHASLDTLTAPASPGARRGSTTPLVAPDAEAQDPIVPARGPSSPAAARLDSELLEGIVDRVLSGPTARDYLHDVAQLLAPALRRHDALALPAALDVVDEAGREPSAVVELRRGLARALVTVLAADGGRGDYWQIVAGWRTHGLGWERAQASRVTGLRSADRHRLLDAGDFRWALDEADAARAAGDDATADAFGFLVWIVFDQHDPVAFELAYRRQDNPAWAHLRGLYEAVQLDSDLAVVMRRGFQLQQSQPAAPWPPPEGYTAQVRAQLAAAVDGDTNAFSQLLWNLQFDPTIGRPHPPSLHGDLLSFPGTKALGADAVADLQTAALRYLPAEHDHAESWLGHNGCDLPVWAGCLALAFLDAVGRTQELPDALWASWTGAIVWFPITPADAGCQQRLLSHAAQHAPDILAARVARLVRGSLESGRHPWELEVVDPGDARELADMYVSLLDETAAALVNLPDVGEPAAERTAAASTEAESVASNDRSPSEHAATVPDVVWLPGTNEGRTAGLDTWEMLLGHLFAAGDNRAEGIARRALARTDGRGRRLRVRAAGAMLGADAKTFLHEILAAATGDTAFGHELALACAERSTRRPTFSSLDEPDLAGMYRWLAGLFPPSTDVWRDGFLSANDQAREWRDRALSALGQRATPAAVAELTRLASEDPHRRAIAITRRLARRGAHEAALAPPTPAQVAALLTDNKRRLVQTPDDLADLVLDTLDDVHADLPSHGELLWDRQGARSPKDLCDLR